MLPTTLQIIKSGLQGDPTVTPSDRIRLIALLRDGNLRPKDTPTVERVPILLRRVEVARRFAISLRTLDKLAASGVLQKRKLPGRIRASGFLESDVSALIIGGLPK